MCTRICGRVGYVSCACGSLLIAAIQINVLFGKGICLGSGLAGYECIGCQYHLAFSYSLLWFDADASHADVHMCARVCAYVKNDVSF